MLALGAELFVDINRTLEDNDRCTLVFGDGGMTSEQIASLESELALPLPDDLKFLLRNVRESDTGLSPWASLDRAAYAAQMNWVHEGIAFDVEHANVWLRQWGEQPRALSAALEIARDDFARWPKLFPLFGHRFLAVEPCLDGNPVFSVMQTDIICYGANLAHYLLLELGPSRGYDHHTSEQNPRHISPWSDFAGNRDAILAWPSGTFAAERAPWRAH